MDWAYLRRATHLARGCEAPKLTGISIFKRHCGGTDGANLFIGMGSLVSSVVAWRFFVCLAAAACSLAVCVRMQWPQAHQSLLFLHNVAIATSMAACFIYADIVSTQPYWKSPSVETKAEAWGMAISTSALAFVAAWNSLDGMRGRKDYIRIRDAEKSRPSEN
ncbi:Hypothetical Protein FCC1311_048422 [Hondaea fermentalgiana]|uniref:Uncharacterized protein n=1 Tax=Hondaea fermentalgiana TaxID=2315210 RepID=A0A2R5GK14_9STRA|nr:Hypothetical Protein FCC1311_048422 [Hondaea fermentalgiana]|eukprot:GBG28621.1 Hypothetical Protein FCC1311_048422 [Hondaea fermentalgiana]